MLVSGDLEQLTSPPPVPHAATHSQQGWRRTLSAGLPCSALVPALPGLLCTGEMLWEPSLRQSTEAGPYRLSEQLADPWSPPQGLEEQRKPSGGHHEGPDGCFWGRLCCLHYNWIPPLPSFPEIPGPRAPESALLPPVQGDEISGQVGPCDPLQFRDVCRPE